MKIRPHLFGYFFALSLGSTLFAAQAKVKENGNDEEIQARIKLAQKGENERQRQNQQPLTENQKKQLKALIDCLGADHLLVFPSLTPSQEKENELYEALHTTLGLPPYPSKDFILKKYHHGKNLGVKSIVFVMKSLFMQKNITLLCNAFSALLKYELLPPQALLKIQFDHNDQTRTLLGHIIDGRNHQKIATSFLKDYIAYFATKESHTLSLRKYKTYSQQEKIREQFVENLFQALIRAFNELTPTKRAKKVEKKLLAMIEVMSNNEIIFHYAARNFSWVQDLRKAIEKNSPQTCETILAQNDKLSLLFQVDLIEELNKLTQKLLQFYDLHALNEESINLMRKENDLLQITKIITDYHNSQHSLAFDPLLRIILIMDDYPIPLDHLEPRDYALSQIIEAIQKYRNLPRRPLKDADTLQEITEILDNLPKAQRLQPQTEKKQCLHQIVTLIENYDLQNLIDTLLAIKIHRRRVVQFYNFEAQQNVRKLRGKKKSIEFKHLNNILYQKNVTTGFNMVETLQKKLKAVGFEGPPLNTIEKFLFSPPTCKTKFLPWELVNLLVSLHRKPPNRPRVVEDNHKVFYFLQQENPYEAFNAYYDNYEDKAKKSLLYKSDNFYLHVYDKTHSCYTLFIKQALEKGVNYLPNDYYNGFDSFSPSLIMMLASLKKSLPPAKLTIDITKEKDPLKKLAQKGEDKHLGNFLDWTIYGYNPIIAMDIEKITAEITPPNPQWEKNRKKWKALIKEALAYFNEKQWLFTENPYAPIQATPTTSEVEAILSLIQTLRQAYQQFAILKNPQFDILTQKKTGFDLLLLFAKENYDSAIFAKICTLYQKAGIQLWKDYLPQRKNQLHPLLNRILCEPRKGMKKGRFGRNLSSQKKKYQLFKTITKEEGQLHAFYNHINHFFYRNIYANQIDYEILPNTPSELRALRTAYLLELLSQNKALNVAEKEKKVLLYFQKHWQKMGHPKSLKDGFYNALVSIPSFREKLWQRSDLGDPKAPRYITFVKNKWRLHWEKDYERIKAFRSFLHFAIEMGDMPFFYYFFEQYKSHKTFKSYVDDERVREKKNHGRLLYKHDIHYDQINNNFNLCEYALNFNLSGEKLRYLIANGKNLIPPMAPGNLIERRETYWKNYSIATSRYIRNLQRYNSATYQTSFSPLFLLLTKPKQGNWQSEPKKSLENLSPSPYYKDLLFLFEAQAEGKKELIDRYIKTFALQNLTPLQKEYFCMTLLAYPMLRALALASIQNNKVDNPLTCILHKLQLEETNCFPLLLKYEKAYFLTDALLTPSAIKILTYLTEKYPHSQDPHQPYQKRYLSISMIYYYTKIQPDHNPLIETLKVAEKVDHIGFFEKEYWTQEALVAFFQKGKNFITKLILNGKLIVSNGDLKKSIDHDFIDRLATYGTLGNMKTFIAIHDKFRFFLQINYLEEMVLPLLMRKDQTEAQKILSYILHEEYPNYKVERLPNQITKWLENSPKKVNPDTIKRNLHPFLIYHNAKPSPPKKPFLREQMPPPNPISPSFSAPNSKNHTSKKDEVPRYTHRIDEKNEKMAHLQPTSSFPKKMLTRLRGPSSFTNPHPKNKTRTFLIFVTLTTITFTLCYAISWLWNAKTLTPKKKKSKPQKNKKKKAIKKVKPKEKKNANRKKLAKDKTTQSLPKTKKRASVLKK